MQKRKPSVKVPPEEFRFDTKLLMLFRNTFIISAFRGTHGSDTQPFGESSLPDTRKC